MPVITIANPKGGSGKSTTALVLGTTLASHGARVALIDCDPNQPLKAWRTGLSDTTAVIVPDMSESKIIPVIDSERAARQFVIIDLEGTASRMVSRAIARSDLVLIPMAASALDAAQAARAVSLIHEEEQLMNRRIAHRVLFTRTNPQIPSKNEKLIMAELQRTQVPILKTHLNLRTAFMTMFTAKRTLRELDPSQVNGLDAAIKNADDLAAEIVAVIKKIQQEKRSAA